MLPLTAAELDKRLDYLLNPVLSTRRTAAPLAHALATLDRSLQDFTLHWVEVIGRTNYEMAYQFAAAAPAAMAALDREAAEAWIIQAMDSYDYEGLHHGTLAFKNFRTFITHANAHQAVYDDVAPVLELFVCGLSGRRMKFDSAPVAWTDTDTLYLPPYMAAGVDHAHNFLIYKIMVTLLWAQSRFGTFSANLDEAVQRHSDPTRALEWLSFLESVRLEAQIARVLPGLARDLAGLRGEASDGDERYAPLRSASASVQDSIALLNTLTLTDPTPHHAWSGTLRPAHAMATRAARLAREKNALQSALAAFIDEQSQAGLDANNAESAVGDIKINVKAKPGENGEMEFELQLGGTPIAPPDVVRNLLNSIIQDLGEVPDDYLTPAADNIAYHPAGKGTDDAADTGNDVDLHDNTARLYNEWDYQRHHYRKNWCVLRELDVHPGDDTFVGATLNKYAPQVAQLRRSFEMLRGEDRLLKRMKHGDDIDLDAVVSAYADMRSGRELSERLLVKRHKAERNLAVLFMVDMSGSTKGWINDAEREALVLLSEALEVLGDRYAIYGFSGITRKRCEIFRVKRFDEPYSDMVRRRIAGIQPQDYTRMGVAIRHLTALFENVDARTKLLITLSDGKPDDYSDNYRGEYGIEDTRQALFETHRAGIKPFCITIDHEARAYLPHMYGAANWTLVDDVSRLPLKVADIYRRLTT